MNKHAWLLMILAVLSAMLAGCPSGGGGGSFSFGNSGGGNGTGDHTVLLMAFDGPGHMAKAADYKSRLASKLGWRGLFVVSEGLGSKLYWGRFESIVAAKPTLKRARDHRARNGAAVFGQAIIGTVPGSNTGPMQWHISRCPGKHTLLVHDFKDVPEFDYVGRRKFAEDYCRELRGQGHEAYYFHGPKVSSVTVGSFSDTAFRWETRLKQQPGQPAPVKVRKPIPASPVLLALMKKFPDLALNGRKTFNVHRDPHDSDVVLSKKPAKTYTVKVPGK